jgi:hypothetical protein
VSGEVFEFVQSLRLPPFAEKRRRELMDYGNALGLDALKRQLDLGQRFYRCCWEPNDGAHHPLCPSAKKAAA